MKQAFKNVWGTVALLAIYTVLQQGPTLLSNVVRFPIYFHSNASQELVADVSLLRPGKYYLSVGHTLSFTEIRMNGMLLQEGELTAGAPFSVSGDQRSQLLSIKVARDEKRRDQTYDTPVVTSYGIGFLIQEWRVFNGIFMGPVFSFLLVIMALLHMRLSERGSNQVMPHLLFGVTCLFYSLFLSNIPNLFFDRTLNLAFRIALRSAVSAAFVYLVGIYSKLIFRRTLMLHIFCALLGFVFFAAKKEYLFNVYVTEQVFVTVVTFFVSFRITKAMDDSFENRLIICLSWSWSIIQVFAVSTYYFLVQRI